MSGSAGFRLKSKSRVVEEPVIVPPKPASKGGSHLTLAQRWQIYYFLQNKKDFNLVEGIHQDAYVVAGKELKKINGFERLAEHINEKCPGSDRWTGLSAKERYRNLKKKYKDVKKSLDGPSGAGLTEEEYAAGITLDQKLERAFPLYAQWDSLYGDRQNVNPH